MKKIILLLTILTLSLNMVSSQTVFGWETATDDGATITETIAGITVTLSGDPDLELFDGNGYGGTSGNVALTQNVITSVTFTFNQPVSVNSIIPIEASGGTVDYTFTPTGGANSPVVASVVLGTSPTVNLNWVNVTSFTVSAPGAAFGFDDLSVDTGTNGQTFFEWETANNSGGTITETVNGIGVTVAGDSSYGLVDYGGASGTSGQVILSNANRTSITFTFTEAVVVNSILALEGTGANIDYTFTPTGGNDNSPVTKSLVSGATAVSLNWVGVTAFTVTSSGGEFGFDNLSVTGMGSPILFDWETAVELTDVEDEDREYVESTIDGIKVTVKSTGYGVNWPYRVYLNNYDYGFGGATGKYIQRGDQVNNPVIFTFSEPVVVSSILPLERYSGTQLPHYDIDFTFTPTGGNNPAVTVTLIKGEAPTGTISLNWVDVSSFTVTAYIPSKESNAFAPIFDDLLIYPLKTTLGVDDNHKLQKATIYPNPVVNTLYIKNVSELKSVSLYNLLGQEVLQAKATTIDMSHLSKGVYILQISIGLGTVTKRVIKN